EPVPTLLATLLALSGLIGIDIELKQLPGEPDFEPEGHGLVEATLQALDRSAFVGPVLMSSFNPLAIRAVRERAPDLPTGLLSAPSVDADVALDFARREGHGWVLPPVARVSAAGGGFASRVHHAGLRVAAWNTDDPAQALELMRAGVDAVATNDPAAIVAARGAR
ncbi:MAG: glycerophosphodiester phosphodiesterase, partial [Actinomycetota bacterium]